MGDWSEEGVKTFVGMMEAYLVERDVEATMSFFHENAVSIGSNDREIAYGKERMRQLAKEEIDKQPESLSVNYGDIRVEMLDDHACSLTAEVIVGREVSDLATMSMLLRDSVVMVKEQGEVLITLVHTSAPTESQEFTGFYPTRWGKERQERMDDEYQSKVAKQHTKAVQGANLVVYQREDYPIYYVNNEFVEWLDYSKEEFFRMSEGLANNCIHPYDREEFGAHMESAREDSLFQAEFRLAKKDGSYVWGLAVGQKMIMDDEQIVVWMTLYDVSASYQEKKKVTVRDDQIQQLTEVLDCGLRIAGGFDNFDTYYASKSLIAKLGYNEDEFKEVFITGRAPFVCSEDNLRVQREIRIAFLDSPFYTVEYRVRKKDGSYLEVCDHGRKYLNVDGSIRISSVLTYKGE